MKRKAFLVGHITNDTEPFNHLGGAIAYSGVAMSGLGTEVHIITKCPPNHPYIQELEQRGVIVHNLPVRDPYFKDKITSFENIEDKLGHRRQIVKELQEEITVDDLPNFPEIPLGSIIGIQPVNHEVDDLELFPKLAGLGPLMVAPQGYFRQINPNGKVSRRQWQNLQALIEAEITILSDEDLTFNSKINKDTLAQIIHYCPLVILTEGAQGLTIYEKNGDLKTHIKPYLLEKDEIKDRVGAGDSFAAAFSAYYLEKPNAVEAGVFGAYFSALKIKGIGHEGIGIKSIPSLKDVTNFTISSIESYNRYQQFLKENRIYSLHFLPEKQNHSIEKF